MNDMPVIDMLLPKPLEEMTPADVLAFMQETQDALTLWVAGMTKDRAPMKQELAVKALQCIAWGMGVFEGVIEAKSADDGTPEYDFEEAVWFVHHRTDLDRDVIRKVLEADEAYMVDKGIIEQDPTPGASPSPQ